MTQTWNPWFNSNQTSSVKVGTRNLHTTSKTHKQQRQDVEHQQEIQNNQHRLRFSPFAIFGDSLQLLRRWQLWKADTVPPITGIPSALLMHPCALRHKALGELCSQTWWKKLESGACAKRPPAFGEALALRSCDNKYTQILTAWCNWWATKTKTKLIGRQSTSVTSLQPATFGCLSCCVQDLKHKKPLINFEHYALRDPIPFEFKWLATYFHGPEM